MKKTITKLPNVTKDSLAKSKKQNDDYISSVVKKMKDYLKDGSKGKYDMEPKHFPKGNGELAKMDKMAVPLPTSNTFCPLKSKESISSIIKAVVA